MLCDSKYPAFMQSGYHEFTAGAEQAAPDDLAALRHFCVGPMRTQHAPEQVDAERRLLQAALRDPLNQRFVLLSEACLPIYPPQLLWAQLMGEQKARVNACAAPTPEDAERRYVARRAPVHPAPLP